MKKPCRLGQGRLRKWLDDGYCLASRQCAIAGQLPHAVAVTLEHVLDGTEVHACHGFVETRRERRLEESHQVEDGREVFAEEVSPVVDEIPQGLGFSRGEDERAFGDCLCGELWLQLASLNERERSLKLFPSQILVAGDLEGVVQRVLDRLVVDGAVLCAGLDGLSDFVHLFGRERCRRFVASSLADGGQNFGRNPALESLCRFELGAEDQGIETGLVDAVDRLAAAFRFDFGLDDVFGVDVLFDRVCLVFVSESTSGINGDKEREVRRAERTDLSVLE